jgi:hypothetical protein
MWRAQSSHNALPTAMADGSVRMIAAGIDRVAWGRLMLPRDGLVVPE